VLLLSLIKDFIIHILFILRSPTLYHTPLPSSNGIFFNSFNKLVISKGKKDLKNYQESLITHQKERIFICWVGYNTVKDVRE
ncbi:MAG: hypothetical protein ABIK46_05455, partial [candidate division WOR-3 bacterium]